MSDVSDQRKYYERMMDEVGAEYRRRIADLQAENDKLREELDAAKHDLSVFSGEIVASKAENAKLRELVRELYEDQCDELDEWRYRDRMRELGVEVGDVLRTE